MIKRIALSFVCSGMLLGGAYAAQAPERIESNQSHSDEDVTVLCNLNPVEAANRYLKLFNAQADRLLQHSSEFYASMCNAIPEIQKIGDDIDKNFKGKNNPTPEELKAATKQIVEFAKPFWIALIKGTLLSPEESLDAATYLIIMSKVDKDIHIKFVTALLDACVDFVPQALQIKAEIEQLKQQMPSPENIAQLVIKTTTCIIEQVKITIAQTIQKNIIAPTLAMQQTKALTLETDDCIPCDWCGTGRLTPCQLSHDKDVVILCTLDPVEAAKRYLKLYNTYVDRVLQNFPEYYTSINSKQQEFNKVFEAAFSNIKDQNNPTPQEIQTIAQQVIEFFKPLMIPFIKNNVLTPEQSLDMAAYIAIMSKVDKDINVKIFTSLLDACVDFAPTIMNLKDEHEKLNHSGQPLQEVSTKFMTKLYTLVMNQVKASVAQTIQKNIIDPTLVT